MTEEKTRRWGENVIIADFAGRRRRKQAEQGLRSEDNSRENPMLGGRPKGGKVGTPGANGPREQGFRESWAARVMMQQLVAKSDSGRVSRGREYFRAGKVNELVFETDSVAALVAGSQLQPFDVRLSLPPLSEKQRANLLGEVLREHSEVHALAAGSRPGEAIVEGLLGQETGGDRFAGMRVWCDCPDKAEVCKHAIALGFAVSEYLSEVPLRLLSWRGIDTEPITRLMQYMQVPAVPRHGHDSKREWGADSSHADAANAAVKAMPSAGAEPDIVDPEEFWGGSSGRVRWGEPTAQWGLESGERAQLEKAIRTVTWNSVDQLNTMSELERCYESLGDTTPVFDYSSAWGEAMSDGDGKD
ncbi:hypothetical protein CRES_1438 [Corynebacterium resistens DSM 45100]|uniref:SWIM-type domain-containing protein n=1 Tax=Corynebacterium resistens (strain DSM 45100 / JCM 12819 / GTC 2026 / SICGH 158) TaxID=662755 RepID=F8DZH3_CORRG|nr:hypothetical protein [Corynebacterium resistens]AEI09792.1 hypothetical protein CRES_1438 [Corynebacterium resistens DSM 45100]